LPLSRLKLVLKISQVYVHFDTIADINEFKIKDSSVRIGDTSGRYSNVSFTNKAVISIEDNLMTSVSQKLTLAFELLTTDQSLKRSKMLAKIQAEKGH
jgi:hypothetical protein